MPQHFPNRPSLRRRLPAQQIFRQITKHRFEQNRRLFKEQQGRLHGSSDARLGGSNYTSLHGGTSQAITASYSKSPRKIKVAHNKQHARRRRPMGRIVALMDDLFFQMKVAETAKHLGLELKVATNGEALLSLLEPAPNLVIVDLNARGQPLAVIERVRAAQKDLRVIGFLSHVQRELAEQAQVAGCNEVMPRSTFTQNLAAILGSAKD